MLQFSIIPTFSSKSTLPDPIYMLGQSIIKEYVPVIAPRVVIACNTRNRQVQNTLSNVTTYCTKQTTLPNKGHTKNASNRCIKLSIAV